MAIEINGRVLDGKRTYIVAEGGTCFARKSRPKRMTAACKIVEYAAMARCDAVKFQMFVADEPLFCPLPGDEKRWRLWRHAVMNEWAWSVVQKTAKQCGIDLFFSVFQRGGIDMCLNLGVPVWKVASRAAKTFPYDAVPGPFIVSGGFGLPEKLPHNTITLKCTPKYPSPLKESWWEPSFDGLSDHSGTPWPAVNAILCGAALVEVHFKAGRGQHGEHRPDFTSSLKGRDMTIITRCRDAVAASRADSR